MIQTIYIDMDGVVASFAEPILRAYGRRVEEMKGQRCVASFLGISDSALDDICCKASFWFELPRLSEADKIVSACWAQVGPENVAFLTDPGRWDAAIRGKQDWVRHHFGGTDIPIIFTARKELLASPTALLIEDYEENVEKWLARGGAAILIPRHWNRRHADADRALDCFEADFEGVFKHG